MKLTAERAREVLRYEPETGVFTWHVSRGTKRAGSRAGCTSNGRRTIRIDGELFFANRLAWFMVNGAWPPDEIDHCDGAPLNDKLGNLRPATRLQNQQNKHRAYTNNKCGTLGVNASQPGRFRARIRTEGSLKHLGYFDSAEAAHVAYLAAKAILHPFGEVAK